MTKIELYKSPWRAIKVILLCSIFVALGAFLVYAGDPEEQWIAWGCIAFFGLGYPVGFYHLFDKKPQIIIDKEGVFDRMLKLDKIPWEVIQDVYLTDVHSQKFISMKLDKSFVLTGKKAKNYQRSAKLNKAFGFEELNLNLSQIKIDEVRLLGFMGMMLDTPAEEREALVKRFSELLKSA